MNITVIFVEQPNVVKITLRSFGAMLVDGRRVQGCHHDPAAVAGLYFITT